MKVFSHRVIGKTPLRKSYDSFITWCVENSISHSLSNGITTTMVSVVPDNLVDEYLSLIEIMREEHKWNTDSLGVINALAT